ncbi:MAG TPA: hypothetical protein VMV18_06450, partial [bacterium]|nr:hypothetical protein [bacterium]
MTRARCVAAALLLAAVSSGCPLLHPQRPNVTLQKVDVNNVDFAGAKLTAVLDVENRFPASITTARST